MPELITIYKAHPDNVSQILQVLESRNLHPTVVDDSDKMGAYGAHTIRIAVPQIERDMAVNILAEFDRQDKSRISELVKTTNGIFLIVIALLVMIAIIGFIDKKGKWFFAAWMVIVAFVGFVLVRIAWSKKTRIKK
jgi:quinol-cytochrome oxidoreductase complex cytochrome b subunit